MSNQESVTTFRIQDYWTSGMQKIIASADRFESKVKTMHDKTGKAFDGIKAKAEAFKIRNMEAINGVAGEVPMLGRAITLATNPYVAGAAAAVGMGVAAKKAADYAQQWEAKMAEVNVTAQLGKKDLKDLSDELLNVGKRNVAPLEQVPEAFNRILSAGLDVKTSFEALEPTLRAAKGVHASLSQLTER